MNVDDHVTNIVVCALIHRDNKIFVARRAAAKTTFPDQWELPGGHVDPGEDLKAALQRELSEELGIEVEIGQAVDAFTYTSEDTFKVEIVYLCQIIGNVTEPVLHPADHSEARWLSSDTIEDFEKADEETEVLKHGFALLEKGVA